jgi:ABC-type dipeptide/oligopeptide/nickel transport system permease component
MLAFALKRVLWTIPVLVVCMTILFGLMRAIQGTPAHSRRSVTTSRPHKVEIGGRRC